MTQLRTQRKCAIFPSSSARVQLHYDNAYRLSTIFALRQRARVGVVHLFIVDVPYWYLVIGALIVGSRSAAPGARVSSLGLLALLVAGFGLTTLTLIVLLAPPH